MSKLLQKLFDDISWSFHLLFKKCEVCKGRATRAAADEYEQVSKYDQWEEWRVGDIHYGCAEHKPPAQSFKLT